MDHLVPVQMADAACEVLRQEQPPAPRQPTPTSPPTSRPTGRPSPHDASPRDASPRDASPRDASPTLRAALAWRPTAAVKLLLEP